MAFRTADSPQYPKRFEKQFAEFTAFMIEAMAKQYSTQTVKALSQTTVNKFSDEQAGNYSKVFLGLSKKAKRKIIKRFSDDRLEKLVKLVLGRVNKYNQSATYSEFSKSSGIDLKQLVAGEKMKPQFNALMAESTLWVQGLRDEALKSFEVNSLRIMSGGGTLDQVYSEIDLSKSKKVNAAKFIARNQVASFNSLSTKMRYQNLGVKKAIWITARDERVRPCHEIRNGQEFDLSVGLFTKCDGKTLFPAVDYNCRCTYKAIIEGFNNED
jgi:SPP1 gp7 family putative phage head morphogenesis protein